MKKYIFIEGSIDSIGGSQRYISQKISFLESCGWTVLVLSAVKPKKVLLDNLRKFEKAVFYSLLLNPNLLSKRRIASTIKKIRKYIGQFDYCVIESNHHFGALWGELMASELKCLHLVYLLGENLQYIKTKYLPFYKFKLDRNELYVTGNSKEKADSILKQLFGECYSPDPNSDYHLIAYQGVAICDDSLDLKNYDDTCKTITMISRLEKKTAKAIIDEIFIFVVSHKKDRFNVILVGPSDPKSIISNIQSKFSNTNNVNLIITGELSPIPKTIFEKTDIFVSSAACATLSYEQDKPTISVDEDDCKAIGVLGYTTFNSRNRDFEPLIDISDLLEKCIYDNFLQQKDFAPKKKYSSTEIFNYHMLQLKKMSSSKDYFSISHIQLSLSEKFSKIFVFIFGIKAFRAIIRFVSSLSKTK